MLQDVHYIWIGPPAAAPFWGQDTIGAELTKKKHLDHNIYFWCLKEHKLHYQRHFYQTGVLTQCIENYAKERDEEFYEFVEALKISALKQTRRQDKAREYTTIKAAFQFFLQIDNDGYFSDTNVIPNPNFHDDALPQYQRFTFPYVVEPGYKPDADPWLMFSPTNERRAEARFNEYFLLARREFQTRNTGEKIDRLELGQAFVDSASYSYGAHKMTELVSNNNDGLCVQIGAFQKRYYNTHKSNVHTEHHFYEIISGKSSLDELAYLLNTSQFDTSTIETFEENKKTFNTTLLHHAIDLNKSQELSILLPYASNPNIKAQKNSFTFSKTLIEATTCPNCLEVLVQFYLNENFGNNPEQLKNTIIFVLNLVFDTVSERNLQKITSCSNDELSYIISHFKGCNFLTPLKKTLDVILPLGPINQASSSDYIEALKPLYYAKQTSTYTLLSWLGITNTEYRKHAELYSALESFTQQSYIPNGNRNACF